MNVLFTEMFSISIQERLTFALSVCLLFCIFFFFFFRLRAAILALQNGTITSGRIIPYNLLRSFCIPSLLNSDQHQVSHPLIYLYS